MNIRYDIRRIDRLPLFGGEHRTTNDPVYVTPIQGTNSWRDLPFKLRTGTVSEPLWWQPGSRYLQHLEGLNVLHERPEHPFVWDTELGGVFWRSGHRGWQAAGMNLYQRFEFLQIHYDRRNFVVHSHARQVFFYACAYGLVVRNVVLIGGPVRKDMNEACERARPRIGYLHAIYDPEDEVQQKGTWFDGDWEFVRAEPWADSVDRVAGIGHSKPLYQPEYFSYWERFAWHEFFRLPSKAKEAVHE